MANYGQVSYGSKGSDVTELQKLLKNNGYTDLAVDGDFGAKTQAAVKDYQQKNGLAVDGIVGTNTWGALTNAQSGSQTASTPAATAPAETKAPTFEYGTYTPSDTVSQAEALLQQQLSQKPGAYQSAWQAQLNDIIQKIQNREEFTYDLNGDALYQQYKDQYTTQGKLAAMDVAGQAAAMSGGYGNSYAQTAGQQAYQAQLQQLNNVIPELYQLALNQHNQEEQALYDQASLLAGMENQDYGRYRDNVSDYYTELNRLTEDARYKAEDEYSKWADDRNFSYGQFSDDRAYDYQVGRDKVADEQWQAQFDEAKRQYDEQMALSKSKSSGGGDGGGSYDAEAAKKQQELVNAGYDIAVDGIWGPQSQAAWEKYQSGGNPTATEATDSFEKKIHPESQHDAIARKMYGSYRDYVDKEIQSALKNGELTENEAVWLYSKYKIYD